MNLIRNLSPEAYRLGWQPFCGLCIRCRRPTLIPRVETEHWVRRMVGDYGAYRDAPLKVLDIGTGTGCIAAALARSFPKWSIAAADISPRALSLARLNCQPFGNVTVVRWDVFSEPFTARFDLIVSNPPYIPRSERYSHVQTSVQAYESPTALFTDDADGTAFHERIAEIAPQMLSPMLSALPNVVLECHSRRRHLQRLVAVFQRSKFLIRKDLFGRPRTLHLWI